MAEDNIYRCESCGGVMEFDVASQTLKCPHCGTSKVIINDSSKVIEHSLDFNAKRKIKVEEKQSRTMECSGCGAKIEISSNDTAAKCPYCGSSYVLAKTQEEVLIPDGIVPFKIDKNQVGVLFRTWIKKRWLAPGELKKLYQYGSFQGIYVPYWTFDAQTDCYYTGEGGRDRTITYEKDGEKHTRIETDWYFTSGRINHFFDDVQVPATERYQKGFFSGIEPFNMKQVMSYSPDYISGNLSEKFSVDLESGHREALVKMENELINMASNEIRRRYDRARNVRVQARYYNETYKYLLLPIYSTSYNFKNKTYNVLINGQTGKIKGEYPKSPVKIALIVIAIIIVVILYFYFNNN